jgi:hypothetical protein
MAQPKALNAKYLSRPKSGMIVKDEGLLPQSHYYYRFAHSNVKGKRQTREQIVGGAWWMSADVFNTIRHKAEDTDSHLSATARRDLAVPRRWRSKVDIVVRALLTRPLWAYFGIGTFQIFDEDVAGDLPVWIPAREAMQIYIPGLREKESQTGAPIFQLAFQHVSQDRIGWDPGF